MADKCFTTPCLLARHHHPATLTLQANMRGFDMGGLHLDTSTGKSLEACLTMVATTRAGSPVFDNLSNIRFTLENKQPANTRQAAPAPATSEVLKEALPTKTAVLGAHTPQKQQQQQQQHRWGKNEAKATEHPGSLYAYDWIMFDSELEAIEGELAHPFLGATAGMKRAERDAYAAAAARKAKEGLFVPNESGHRMHSWNSSAAHQQSDWQALRRQYLWPDGQGKMESLFSPYESEGIYTCHKCQPDV
jgi:hypothetical protein